MPENQNVETYHEGEKWKVKPNGNSRASFTFDTKREAQDKGREMAKVRGGEHTIKNMDGRISQKNSYGNDPKPPKDKR